MPRGLLPWAIGIALALSFLSGNAYGANPSGPAGECAGIADDGERLRCFDGLSGRGPGAAVPVPAGEGEDPPEREGMSILSRLWDLDRESRQRKFAITPYRSNYILPFTYNTTPNEAPVQGTGPGQEVKNREVLFQISFKVKLWQDVLGKEMDLWMAYTQRSFWQFYQFENSSPFRETDFEPELLLNLRTDYDILGFRGRYLNAGMNHQSNGQTDPKSRSWNRVVANAGFERGNVILLLHAWYRIPEDREDDDNPDIEKYLGYGQVDVFLLRRGHRFGIMVRNNLRGSDNRGAVQLEWSFPLLRWVSGYAQYFHGYGESLIDYDASTNRVGIGFILKEW